MLKSFRIWLCAAAVVSLLTAALHVIGGGPEFHEPALASNLPQSWKVAFSSVWHEITALLFFNGIFLSIAALLLRKNKLVLWLVFFLNLTFAALFFGYGIAYLETPFVLLQWIIFVLICLLIGLALRSPESLNQVEEVRSRLEHFSFLPQAMFADTYIVHGAHFDVAIEAARASFGKSPVWISKLKQFRNTLVAPFGLVSEPPKPNPSAIGMFPVLLNTKDKVVLGLDDKHLDFRVIVELFNAGTSVSLTTLVRTHNVFGKAYLAIIMPFHRIIAATILQQAVLKKPV